MPETAHESVPLGGLEAELLALQDQVALIDLYEEASASYSEFLIKKTASLKIRMDGNQNHRRPHIHIDYKRKYHFASYAIDDGSILAGNGKYSRVIKPWISENKVGLLKLWDRVREKGIDDEIVAELRGSDI